MNKSLLVVTESMGSGMGRFTIELANAIQQAGVEVHLVCPKQAQEPQVATVKNVTVPATRTRFAKFANLARLSLVVAGEVWARANRTLPVLMVHLAPSLPVSLAPVLAAKARGARLALSLHDFYPHTLRFPPRLHWLERALYRWAYRRFDVILTTTAEQTLRLQAEAGYPAERIGSLYHGVFTVPGVSPPSTEPDTTLLVFGSLRPNKRVLESIEAVRSLRESGVPVRLRIAGSPRREDADYWSRCLAALPEDRDGFDVNARFIADDELAEMYSGVDAFLCPYADFDSQSGVAMTAVSNGIPVIGTAAAKAVSLEVAGESWSLIASNPDAADVADAIRSFMAVPRAKRQAGAALVKADIQRSASWQRLGAMYLEKMNSMGFWPDERAPQAGTTSAEALP